MLEEANVGRNSLHRTRLVLLRPQNEFPPSFLAILVHPDAKAISDQNVVFPQAGKGTGWCNLIRCRHGHRKIVGSYKWKSRSPNEKYVYIPRVRIELGICSFAIETCNMTFFQAGKWQLQSCCNDDAMNTFVLNMAAVTSKIFLQEYPITNSRGWQRDETIVDGGGTTQTPLPRTGLKTKTPQLQSWRHRLHDARMAKGY